jgi:hypothetical protein
MAAAAGGASPPGVLRWVVSPEDIRRWMAGRRAAERREREERRAVDPQAAFRRGLAMIALASRLHGWPRPESETDRRQDREAYARWARLRRRLAPR